MNVNRMGVTKVAAINDHMRAFPCQVMCLQEVNINTASVATWMEAWRAHGYHAFLGVGSEGLHRTAVLSRAPGHPIRLPSVGDQSRYSAVALEFQFGCGVRKVVVVSVYSYASDCEAAASYVEEIIHAVRGLGLDWLVLGDFNVTAEEPPMARRLAAGLAEPLDSAFLAEGSLPGTAGGVRRIDYGLASGRLYPVAVSHARGIANHIAVSYEFSFSEPEGFTVPSRAPLRDVAVSAAAWDGLWDVHKFRGMLLNKDLDAAWQMLSDVAEMALDGGGRGVVARSASWSPQGAKYRSKAAKSFESLGLVRLRRLSRRLTQLARQPGDHRLRGVIGRAVEELQGAFPWLQDLPYFSMEQQAEWVQVQVEEAANVELQAGFERWRSSLGASVRKKTAWIKRRASLKGDLANSRWSSDAEVRRTAIHPVSIIRSAEAEWCPRWTAGDVHTGPVHALLAELPAPTAGTTSAPTFTASKLKRAAAKMVGKASGPDGWEASHFLHLPEAFWCALGELWQCAFASAALPSRWREARVAMVPKAAGGHRPISVLSIAYRLGASVLVRELRSWADGWLGHQMLGGVHHRSARDAFLRIVEASEDPNVVFIGQDISKYFDSIHAVHLQQVLEFLKAPPQFTAFVMGVLEEQWRLFSMGSRVGAQWHRATRGVAQGDPLSPLLAASIMSVWAGTVTRADCEAVTFVDDRSFWGRSLEALCAAKAFSDEVDSAFQFRCDSAKCQVASASGAVGPRAAALFGYSHGSAFETLGVRFCLHHSSVPRLARYSFDVANLRLLCINAVASGFAQQAAFVRTLVLPLVVWAGAMASIEEEQLHQLRRAIATTAIGFRAQEVPSLVLWELLGWECHPFFARRWAAIRAAVSFVCRPPCWLDEAPIRLAVRRWPSVLPVTVAVLGELGWWPSPTGDRICRRDTWGQLRTFHVGFDNEEVIRQWLVDWHRRFAFQKTGRVRESLHRHGEDLAQGAALPGVAAGSLVVLAGHRKLFNPSDRHLRNSALVVGCSVWAKAASRGVSAESMSLCQCGLRMPSRAHLLWQCPSTAHLRPKCSPPEHRAEERLLCKVVAELPVPPCVFADDEVLEELAAELERQLSTAGCAHVGTDGSAIKEVAAWAVAVENGPTFSSGVIGEDQASYRAEVEGLRRLLMALQTVRTPGKLIVVSDCQSAYSGQVDRCLGLSVCASLHRGPRSGSSPGC